MSTKLLIGTKMDPALKEAWVGALKSGEYTRGEGQLSGPVYDTSGENTGRREYCCLGVLCDLAIKAGFRKTPIPETYQGIPQTEEQARKGVYLPPSIEKWSGINLETQKRLATVNDDEEEVPGKFVKTVEWIEEHL